MNQEFLNPRFLKYYLSVAETGSILAASQELNISQPSITRVVQIIEKSLNKKLFIRSKKGVQLTEDGELFYLNAKSILNFNKKVIEDLKSNKIDQIKLNKTIIKIGIASTLSQTHKENLLWLFNKNNLDLKIRIVEEDSYALINAIKKKSIDFAITCITTNEKNIKKEFIYRDPFCVAFHKGHSFQGLKTIELEHVRKEKNYIFRNNCEFFFYNHLKNKNVYLDSETTSEMIKKRKKNEGSKDVIYTNSDSTAAACIKSGLGVAVIPESVAIDHKLLYSKIYNPMLEREIFLIQHKTNKLNLNTSLVALKNAIWI